MSWPARKRLFLRVLFAWCCVYLCSEKLPSGTGDMKRQTPIWVQDEGVGQWEDRTILNKLGGLVFVLDKGPGSKGRNGW